MGAAEWTDAPASPMTSSGRHRGIRSTPRQWRWLCRRVDWRWSGLPGSSAWRGGRPVVCRGHLFL